MPTIEDPLTGEMRNATEKPPWLIQLEESGAYVEIQIEPFKSALNDNAGLNVTVDGETKEVLGEKQSLSAIGRAALEGEMEKRASLHRYRESEGDPLPKILKIPLAVAYHLRAELPKAKPSGAEESVSSERGGDVKADASPQASDEAGNDTVKDEKKAGGLNEPPTASSFMQMLHSYSKPLFLFSNGSGNSAATRSGDGADSTSRTGNESPPGSKTPTSGDGTGSKDAVDGGKVQSSTLMQLTRRNPSQGFGRRSSGSQAERPMYPMPTVIIVAVISFLIGSLLRSLLSPAEFVAEMPSGGEGTGQGGYEWREIKRLVEIKYLVGGWDFVVAVVRRP